MATLANASYEQYAANALNSLRSQTNKSLCSGTLVRKTTVTTTAAANENYLEILQLLFFFFGQRCNVQRATRRVFIRSIWERERERAVNKMRQSRNHKLQAVRRGRERERSDTFWSIKYSNVRNVLLFLPYPTPSPRPRSRCNISYVCLHCGIKRKHTKLSYSTVMVYKLCPSGERLQRTDSQSILKTVIEFMLSYTVRRTWRFRF